MARGRGRRSVSLEAARDAGASLTPSVALSRLLSPAPSLVDVEDRRQWHPDPDRGAVTVGGRWARVVVHSRPFVARSRMFSAWGLSDKGLPVGVQVPVGLRFESPLKVLTCIRRKVRREVIFARRKAGKGVKRRLPRRNWRSEVVC